MTTSLTVLRKRDEARRFERLRADDSPDRDPDARRRGAGGRLRKRIDGEVRFDKGARAMYSTDGSNYRQVPIGVVIPRDKEDVEATMELAPRVRRADPLARRRDEPGRAVLQRRGGHGLLQVHAPRAGDRPGAAAGAGRAGVRPRRPAATPPSSSRPDLRPRPRDPHPLHAGRDAREQLLRRPLADVQEQRHGPALQRQHP